MDDPEFLRRESNQLFGPAERGEENSLGGGGIAGDRSGSDAAVEGLHLLTGRVERIGDPADRLSGGLDQRKDGL